MEEKAITLLVLLFFIHCTLQAKDNDELFFSNNKVDYFKAEKECDKKNKRLVSIETKEKNDKISAALKKKNDKSQYWTGAVRNSVPPTPYIANSFVNLPFRWPNSHRLRFRSFYKDKPNNVAPYNKAHLFMSLQYNGSGVFWTDQVYNNQFKYICESYIPAPPEPENKFGFVLTGYVYSGFGNILNNCFQMKEKKKKPVRLDTDEKADALRDLLKANDNRIQYFLAAQRNNTASSFKWINGTEVKNANWDDGEPNNSKDYNCILFNWNPSKDQVVWATNPCNGTRRVACEDAEE